MKQKFKIKNLLLRTSILLVSVLPLNGCYKLDKTDLDIKNKVVIEGTESKSDEILPTPSVNDKSIIEENTLPTPPTNIKPIIDNENLKEMSKNTEEKVEEIVNIIKEDIIESSILDERKLVALTFDDGPSAYTLELLDLLDKYDIKATFFVLEYNCKKYPDALIEIANRGHEIAIHGSTHKSFKTITYDEIDNEVFSTISYIESLGITPSNYVRPPFGDINPSIRENTNHIYITWNIDTEDYSNLDKDIISNKITSDINEGCIILMHDTKAVHQPDTDALNEILPELIKEYRFVTITKLAELNNIELEPHITYRKIKK